MSMGLQTTGIENAQRKLKYLQDAVRDIATRKAVTAAARVLADEQKHLAPVLDERTAKSTAMLPESLKNAIDVKVKKVKDGYIEAFIGPKHGKGRAAHLVEFGHRLVKGGGSRIGHTGKFEGTGKVVGFVPAHPFLRPAYDAKWMAMLAEFNETMRQLLKELVN